MERGGPHLGIDALELLGGALVDPWVYAGEDDRILRYSQPFAELCPSVVTKPSPLGELLQIRALPEGSLRAACDARRAVRLDAAQIELGGRALTARLGAVAVGAPGSTGAGLFVVLRDLTELVRVEREYAALKQRISALEHQLEERLAARTRELLAANDELNRLERELARLRRGGY